MKKFKITKEQIKTLIDTKDLCLKETLQIWFPDAFKEELEYGRWLKNDNYPLWLCFFKIDDKNEAFGIDNNGKWFETWTDANPNFMNKNRYATPEEVQTALTKEATKRGYKDGNYKCLSSTYKTYKHSDDYEFYNGKLCSGFVNGSRNIIFDNGTWAEIIKPKELTLQQIADKFEIPIEQLRIKK